MPGPEAARAAATQEATIRAKEILKEALPRLPLAPDRRPSSPAITAALTRATVLEASYQSSGGVVLELGVRFQDLETPPAKTKLAPARTAKPDAASPSADDELSLTVPTMPLEATPTLSVKGKEISLDSAVYRLGAAPKGERALPAKRDKQGRLVLPPSALPRVDGATRAVIYLRNPPRR